MNINLNNYEEWMVAFMDGELSKTERQTFEQFLRKHPELKSELNEFSALQLTPEEDVVFENKTALYKKSGALIYLKKIWPMAAVLVLLLALLPFARQDKSLESTTKIATNTRKETAPAEEKIKAPILTSKQTTVETASQMPTRTVIKSIVAKTTKPKVKSAIEPNQRDEKEEQEIKKEIVQVAKKEIIPNQVKIEQAKNNTPIEEQIVVQHQPQSMKPAKASISETIEPPAIENRILVINEENHPVLHQKLNEVISQVENKIEYAKTLRQTPITVSVGKLKLFTLNN
jgi:hypothetical protein